MCKEQPFQKEITAAERFVQSLLKFLFSVLMLVSFLNNNWILLNYDDSKITCGILYCCVKLTDPEINLCSADIAYIRNGTFKYEAFKTDPFEPKLSDLYYGAYNSTHNATSSISFEKPIIDLPQLSISNLFSYKSRGGNKSYIAVLTLFLISFFLMLGETALEVVITICPLPPTALMIANTAIIASWGAASAAATVFIVIDSGKLNEFVTMNIGVALILLWLTKVLLSMHVLLKLDACCCLCQICNLLKIFKKSSSNNSTQNHTRTENGGEYIADSRNETEAEVRLDVIERPDRNGGNTRPVRPSRIIHDHVGKKPQQQPPRDVQYIPVAVAVR